MMTKQERIAKAEQLHNSGYNCAQSVALAFEDLTGLDTKILENVSAPFGGGVGRSQEVCGTISGMVMVLSLIRNYDCSDPRQKMALYNEEQILIMRFKEKHESIVCRELLTLAKTKGFKHSCGELIKDAVDILATYLEEQGIKL